MIDNVPVAFVSVLGCLSFSVGVHVVVVFDVSFREFFGVAAQVN